MGAGESKMGGQRGRDDVGELSGAGVSDVIDDTLVQLGSAELISDIIDDLVT
jgi:hypothetical protein